MTTAHARAHGALTATLFTTAGVALGLGYYALGVWLAVGTSAHVAYVFLAIHFADRPATVRALTELDTALGAALAETNARLKEIEGKVGFVVTNVSAMGGQVSPRHADGRLRSPVRPPSGANR